MRTPILLAWLIVPVAVAAYHYGPGQEMVWRDDISPTLAEADRAAAKQDWSAAAEGYEQALAKLPAFAVRTTRRVRLERDKAWMNTRRLPEAGADLKGLVDELQADPNANPKVLAESREALASAQYYTTWLMKLEGLGRDDWEPEIEAARQSYRLLAEQADQRGDRTASQRSRENLEGAIRLARLDPGELQGKVIPKQCQGCKSGQCKSKKPGRKPGNNGKPKDARGASSGPPPDNSGS